jgi:hypothetical protein
MNVLWINYESYSWYVHEHSRIHGIRDQFMNTAIHECSSFLQHHELFNNKFIAPSWTYEWIMNLTHAMTPWFLKIQRFKLHILHKQT